MAFSVVKWVRKGARGGGGVGATNEIQRPASIGERLGTKSDRSTSFSLFHLMLTAPSF